MVKYEYKGISLVRYCKDNNISYSGVLNRIINKKMTVEQSISIAIASKNHSPLCKYFYEGLPIKEWCEKNGWSKQTIIDRMARGMTIEQAVAAGKDRINPNYKKGYEKSYDKGIMFKPFQHPVKNGKVVIIDYGKNTITYK